MSRNWYEQVWIYILLHKDVHSIFNLDLLIIIRTFWSSDEWNGFNNYFLHVYCESWTMMFWKVFCHFFPFCFIVKTRKEVKQMTTRDSISATKVRLEELKKTVEAQRARRDEYAAIISQQSQGNFLYILFDFYWFMHYSHNFNI